MEKHSLNRYAEITGSEFEDLKTSIAKGFDPLYPIVIYEGAVLDGWNRYRACLAVGTDPVTIEFDGTPIEAVWAVIKSNVRRDMSASMRAAMANENEELIESLEADARERQGERHDLQKNIVANLPQCLEPDLLPLPPQPSAPKPTPAPDLPPIPPSQPTRTREKLAEAHGVSPRYVQESKRIKATRPDLHEKIKSGAMSIPEAKKVERQETRKAEYEAKVSQATTSTPPTGPFDIILADPPWRYDFAETGNRKIENQYQTATVEEIASHAPNAADNCILFLWATAPKLQEAMATMTAWGFTYKTHAIWDKEKIGMGYWFRGQHELLLVGTKGKPSPPDDFNRVSSVFREARTQHSAKPVCVYEWIEKTFPASKKLEMYCRTPRPTWATWGNEL